MLHLLTGHSTALVADRSKAQIILIEHSLAQKRVRVVQLMVVGIVGILFGGLGNFFVSNSCHFLSIPASSNSNDFILHFGIWKYSPVESSASGYPYCIQYGDPYPEPVASRLTNCLALACAVLSMIILWWYLIVGVPISWSTGVASAAAAGGFQILTPIFFIQSRLCRSFDKCAAGPSVILSCFIGVLWLIVAAELHYNRPAVFEEEEERRSSIASSLELADFQDASIQFWHRFYRPPPMTTSERNRVK